MPTPTTSTTAMVDIYPEAGPLPRQLLLLPTQAPIPVAPTPLRTLSHQSSALVLSVVCTVMNTALIVRLADLTTPKEKVALTLVPLLPAVQSEQRRLLGAPATTSSTRPLRTIPTQRLRHCLPTAPQPPLCPLRHQRGDQTALLSAVRVLTTAMPMMQMHRWPRSLRQC